ncbi:MAG: hypothetical protein A2Z91_04940 [Deltaproteobacteria bacterium GWA2_38_16]|nr:MAG: hypothetical protein A2Z91_04940 [Deltaproteobacteria bacterium GWA2_38_16]OGQ03128.1 MAG: hypothetical protein A3D19_03670 [Deltaproteobacteria bacterium RIFCSPHIGHO2_02_FULL_38_15]OGQ30011.1 MAG: hypothetical protein A3A72_09030 [Deltaproteobacteria bacterium RIFCSPLOWO2_01_FULL_38_9]OGQ61728.1 MAG: hypothetical protein A3G92_01690 [Deltaproteobacteria bacterium RIFCSPLOWO2_12_FULL_38_8]HBQ20452.1 hypothetical protein [Deltaproteobacteria bacterium]
MKHVLKLISLVFILSYMCPLSWAEDPVRNHPTVTALQGYLNQLASVTYKDLSRLPEGTGDANPMAILIYQYNGFYDRANEVLAIKEPPLSPLNEMAKEFGNLVDLRNRWIDLHNEGLDLIDEYNKTANQLNAELANLRRQATSRWYNPRSWFREDAVVEGTAMGDVYVGAGNDRSRFLSDEISRIDGERSKNLRDQARAQDDIEGQAFKMDALRKEIVKKEVELISFVREKVGGGTPTAPAAVSVASPARSASTFLPASGVGGLEAACEKIKAAISDPQLQETLGRSISSKLFDIFNRSVYPSANRSGAPFFSDKHWTKNNYENLRGIIKGSIEGTLDEHGLTELEVDESSAAFTRFFDFMREMNADEAALTFKGLSIEVLRTGLREVKR